MNIFKIAAALALTIALGTVLMSCKKDKDGEETPVSYMKWNGKQYPITTAQNWYNTVAMKDRFFFRTSNDSFSTTSDQLHLFIEIPTEWTNGYKMWANVGSSSYKARVRMKGYDLLIPSSQDTPNPPKITGGYVSIVGGTSGYEISITMNVHYYDQQLGAMTTGYLELYYKGVTTFNKNLATYWEDDEEEDPNEPW